MNTEKIKEVIDKYRQDLEHRQTYPVRMDITKCYVDLTQSQRLNHVHYLLDGLEAFYQDPEKKGKTGRHLGAIQAILCYEGFYSLEELMNHNRPNQS